jgi:ankyrin repeat protein
MAVCRDNIELAKLLIKAGIDVNAKNFVGNTPLHWAVQKDNIEMAKLLIDSGAYVWTKRL